MLFNMQTKCFKILTFGFKILLLYFSTITNWQLEAKKCYVFYIYMMFCYIIAYR